MKVLIIGQHGQLATELRKRIPADFEILCPDRKHLDLEDAALCHHYVLKHKPQWVINAGAYTNVDAAEDDTELVNIVNFESPVHIASALMTTGGKLLQVSTDYVFNGRSKVPYRTDNTLNPINAYGLSKAKAEDYIKMILPKTCTAVVRTSWLYSATGINFVKTMLRLFRDYGEVKVVADQYGSPTWAGGLAAACWAIVQYDLYGTFHWTDGASMSWADFSDGIAEEAFQLKLIDKRPVIHRVATEDYPCKAKRPQYSVLDCTEAYEYLGQKRPDWRANLRTVLQELA